jgi:hypothetical protein
VNRAMGRAGHQSRQDLYNIRFTMGYYTFESRLYGRNIADGITIQRWLASKDRLVGVAEGSTNNWLASELARAVKSAVGIPVIAVRSHHWLRAGGSDRCD